MSGQVRSTTSLAARLEARRQAAQAGVDRQLVWTHAADPNISLTPGMGEWLRLLEHPELERIVSLIRAHLSEHDGLSKLENDRRLALLEAAQAGDAVAEAELKAQIQAVLTDKQLTMAGVPEGLLLSALFELNWGLGPLAPLYRDPTVEEIRVNRYDRVYTVREGRPYREVVRFADEEALLLVVRRMLMHDRIDLTRDQPRVETTRRDGCRVTCTLPPFSRFAMLVVRKFTSMIVTPAEFVRLQSLNEKMLAILRLLARGRANLLVSGATGTGKTTLLRLLIGFLPERLRILTLESDLELNLLQYYPERDVVELEAHPELKPALTLPEAFKTVLRLTPDVIIMAEARAGDADEMVKAAMRGHDGSMGTVHVSSVPEVVPAIVNMILEEKPGRPVPILQEQVATAFQVIVQMVRWPSGRKMIEEITEMYYDRASGAVVYHPLVRWTWSGDDPEQGDWVYPGPASPRLVARLRRAGVTQAELAEVGWPCSACS